MHVQLNTNLCRPKAKQQKPKYTPREWNWLGPKLWALNLPRRSACYKWHLDGVIFAAVLVCATHINYIRRRQRSTQTGNVRWNDESTRRTLFSFRSFQCVRLPFRFCYVARLGHCGQTAQWWIDASRQFSLTTLFASSLTILHRINPRSEKKSVHYTIPSYTYNNNNNNNIRWTAASSQRLVRGAHFQFIALCRYSAPRAINRIRVCLALFSCEHWQIVHAVCAIECAALKLENIISSVCMHVIKMMDEKHRFIKYLCFGASV